MIKRICTVLIPVAGLVLAGCTTTDTPKAPASQKLSPGPKGQFECADRNGSDYIDRAELVYLRQCGVGEDLTCGDVPETVDERQPATNFEAGRRMLEVIDADGDESISELEFRAHCNSTGRAG
ncbi:EF-hand domain-containing protein [Marinobacter fonticola]|uniref:EF-hand domain-containing protein n=1 Tax=Marinobacter fonticola TaxID=2603215 RepID=UPI0011E75C27|nr:EF-hand domain-containing protein [Marinobacter fonticola]